MVRRVLSFSVVMLLSLSIASPSLAQGSRGGEQRSTLSGPRKQLATIVFAGLGGAVLGLSTLSFYGRPQEKLSNIVIGFALGIFAGTAYVTYKAAKNPQELYGLDFHQQLVIPELEASQAYALRAQPLSEPAMLRFSFDF